MKNKINPIEKVFEELNEMKEEGVVEDFVIGGGIALLFYEIPFLATEDIDIFIPPACRKKVLEYTEKKFNHHEDFVNIHGWAVQFFPCNLNRMVEEGCKRAVLKRVNNIPVKVMPLEYLTLNYLYLFRPKDRFKLIFILPSPALNRQKLERLIQECQERNLLLKRYHSAIEDAAKTEMEKVYERSARNDVRKKFFILYEFLRISEKRKD
ncbi:hypothetical protein DRQ20_01505 [bacterium]|nr:MAG: hypothetical protein DRQ20_01505 [bacterium]